jgi:hypothetical protein
VTVDVAVAVCWWCETEFLFEFDTVDSIELRGARQPICERCRPEITERHLRRGL